MGAMPRADARGARTPGTAQDPPRDRRAAQPAGRMLPVATNRWCHANASSSRCGVWRP